MKKSVKFLEGDTKAEDANPFKYNKARNPTRKCKGHTKGCEGDEGVIHGFWASISTEDLRRLPLPSFLKRHRSQALEQKKVPNFPGLTERLNVNKNSQSR